MKRPFIAALLLTAAPALANTTPAQRGEKDTTPAQRAQVTQAAERNSDFDEWGLLGLLGLAGLLGLRKNKPDYTDKDYVGKTGYDRKPGV